MCAGVCVSACLVCVGTLMEEGWVRLLLRSVHRNRGGGEEGSVPCRVRVPLSWRGLVSGGDDREFGCAVGYCDRYQRDEATVHLRSTRRASAVRGNFAVDRLAGVSTVHGSCYRLL